MPLGSAWCSSPLQRIAGYKFDIVGQETAQTKHRHLETQKHYVIVVCSIFSAFVWGLCIASSDIGYCCQQNMPQFHRPVHTNSMRYLLLQDKLEKQEDGSYIGKVTKTQQRMRFKVLGPKKMEYQFEHGKSFGPYCKVFKAGLAREERQ